MRQHIPKIALGFVFLALVLASPFVIAPALNKNKHYSLLEKIKQQALPEDSAISAEISYVSSNKGDCVLFAGLLVNSALSFEEFRSAYAQNKQTTDLELDLVWRNQGSDSVLLAPSQLRTEQYQLPVIFSFYGTDVNKGINELLSEKTETNQVVLFTTVQKSNVFDIRCY